MTLQDLVNDCIEIQGDVTIRVWDTEDGDDYQDEYSITASDGSYCIEDALPENVYTEAEITYMFAVADATLIIEVKMDYEDGE